MTRRWHGAGLNEGVPGGLEAIEGSLFPLLGALGYDIAQTLFVGAQKGLTIETRIDLQRKDQQNIENRHIHVKAAEGQCEASNGKE